MDNSKRILNNARDLFFKYGLRSVTMDDIAHEMGMSKKTLYHAFTNKKEVVEAITKTFLTKHEQEYELLIAKAKDAVDEQLMLMENLNDIFEQLNPRMVSDMQRYFPEAWQIFKNHKNGFMLKKIIANLSRGKKAGLFRKDIHEEIAARMRLEQVQMAMSPEVFPPEKFTIKEIHTQLLLHYLYSITTLKGQKLINKYMDMSGKQAKSY